MTLLNDIQVWTTACDYDQLIPGRGVGVLARRRTRWRCSGSTTGRCTRSATSTRSPVRRCCPVASSATAAAARRCSRRSRSRRSPSTTAPASTTHGRGPGVPDPVTPTESSKSARNSPNRRFAGEVRLAADKTSISARSGRDWQPRPAEPAGDEPDRAGVGPSGSVTMSAPRPAADSEKVRRTTSTTPPRRGGHHRRRSAATASATRGRPSRESKLHAGTDDRREPCRGGVQVALCGRIRCSRRGQQHRIILSPAGFDEPISHHPYQLGAGADWRRDDGVGVAAGGGVGGDVGVARDSRTPEKRARRGRRRAEDLAGCRAEYVDEGNPHLLVQQFGHPLGQVADHLDACGFACAVGDQQKVHWACASGSSMANR